MRRIIALTLGATLPPLAFASEPVGDVVFTPTAEVRPRGEARATLDGSDALLSVNQRTRLGGTFSADSRISAEVVFQDVRLWGEELDTLKDYSAAGIDLHVGALRWNPVDPVTLVVGRQVIAFHEERIVGGVEWAPQGRHFDAVRLTLERGPLSADVVGTVLFEPDSLVVPTNAAAGMLRAGWSPRPAFLIDALYLVDVDDGTDRTRHTVGAFSKAGTEVFALRLEGYYQAGEAGTLSLASHMVGISASYSPKVALEPKLTLWFDRLSGDDDLADGTLTGFEPTWQTGHKYYGRMDLFFATPVDATGRGLHDAAVKFQAAPAKGAQVNLDVHAMLAAAGDDGHLGEEVDLWWTQSVGKHFKVVAGAAAFIPTEGDISTFGWLELGAKY